MAHIKVETKENTVRYISGLTVYQEHLINGRFVSGMRSVAGRPCYQGDADAMGEAWVAGLCGKYEIESFGLEIDGCSLHGNWAMQNPSPAENEKTAFFTAGLESENKAFCTAGLESENAAFCTVGLENAAFPARVAVRSVLDGTGFIERWIDITNTSDKPAALSRIEPMRGLLWKIDDKREHEPEERFSLAVMPCVPWGYEGTLEWHRLTPGITSFESYYGRSGWGVPWFLVKNNISGEMIAGHLEWPANWRMSFECIEYPGQNESLLLFGIGPKARPPHRIIEPGETVESPHVHLGHFTGGLDNAIQKTHRHIRRVARRLEPQGLLIGAARMVDGELDWLESEVKTAAAAGMEYFLIDAGWYGNWKANWYNSTGDWQVSRFGGSLGKAREIILAHGMRFGLWMEPESMGNASELAKINPGWAIQRDGLPADGEGRILDMSKQEVADYVEKSIFSIFEEHKADFFKIDYNTGNINEHGENTRNGIRENAAWRYADALYRIFDRIAEKYPDVFLENCAGGGGRLDLGLFKRCHVSCYSDYTLFPRGIKMLNNLSMALPPERLRFYYRHIPTYHMYGGIETHLNFGMFCNPLFVGFGRDGSWLNPDEAGIVSKYVDLYKNTIRQILADCDVYHHTPGLSFKNTEPWCALEYSAPGKSAGYAGVFKFLDGCGTYTLRLRGVDKSRDYTVTFMSSGEKAVVSGFRLATDGLPVTLDGALSSELILYS